VANTENLPAAAEANCDRSDILLWIDNCPARLLPSSTPGGGDLINADRPFAMGEKPTAYGRRDHSERTDKVSSSNPFGNALDPVKLTGSGALRITRFIRMSRAVFQPGRRLTAA
jgi:hypothetical protein